MACARPDDADSAQQRPNPPHIRQSGRPNAGSTVRGRWLTSVRRAKTHHARRRKPLQRRSLVVVPIALPKLGFVRVSLGVDRPNILRKSTHAKVADHAPPDGFAGEAPRFVKPDAPIAVAQ